MTNISASSFQKMNAALVTWDLYISTARPVTYKLISYDFLVRFHSVMATFWFLICVSGIVSNTINIRTFLRMGLDDSVTVSFFFLAVSDFIYCCIAFVDASFWAVDLVSRIHGPYYFYANPIIFSFFCVWARKSFLISSILITTYLAIQRCLCVAIPFYVKGLFTKFRTYCVLAVIFTFTTTCHVWLLASHSVTVGFDSRFNASHLVMKTPDAGEPIMVLTEVALGLCLNLSCMAIVVICLIVMVSSLRKSSQFRKSATKSATATDISSGQDSASISNQKESRAVKQVAFVCLIFVTTNIPLLGNGLANLIVPELDWYGVYSNVYHLIHNIMYTTELLNSSMNLIVYYTYNTKYRKCFGNTPRDHK